MKKQIIIIVMMCIGLLIGAYGQTVNKQAITVKGVVVDVSGEPIIGASILVKGTTNGTITDFDGHFTLSNVSSTSVLVFSYLGMVSQEITVGNQKTIKVTMAEKALSLNDVVVVGYGTQKKSDITGAVTSVSKERLSKIPVTNVMQAVQGAVSGVNITQVSSIPGESPTVLIRGGGSITASTAPYVVVDGVPITKMGGSMNDINPNDIESIEILKDASSTAIYGMNGANGVILITTKHGKGGKPTIRYSGYFGVDEIAHLPKYCSTDELLARYAEGSRINGTTLYDPPVKYEYEVENYENGHTTNWIDAVSQAGIQQNHNISITGSSNNSNYYISADYLDQKGVLKGYNYKRYSIRTNIDATITDFLKIGTNTSMVHHNRDGGRANFLNAEAMSPYGKMYDANGNYEIYPMFSETLFQNPLLPTTVAHERREYDININGYANVDFGKAWTPLAGLSYKLSASFSYKPTRESNYSGAAQNDELGTAQIYNTETEAYTIENILKYTRDFNKHHVDVTGVYSAQERNYNNSTAKAQDFVNDELLWHRLQAGASSTVASYQDRYASNSQMGRINYSYDNRYLLTGTVRRDGSSVFSKGHKYGTFPSLALGWNLSREKFMNKADFLDNLKLRLSYGKSGNEAVNVYSTFTTTRDVQIALNSLTNIAMITNSLGNQNLTWETKSSINLGIDFAMFRNRINGSIDVYKARNFDLLLKRQLPAVSGFSSVYANIGETQSEGLELTINTVNISKPNFTYKSTLVFSTNKTTIVDLYGDGQDDDGNGWYIGQPIDAVRDYEQVGIWQEDEIANGEQNNWDPIAKAGDLKLKDQNGDGHIDDKDRIIIGQRSPKWIGGLTNTFAYKNWTLNIFLQTVQGALKYNSHIGMASDELTRRNSYADIGYWTPENKSNVWRSLSVNSNPHGYGFYKKNNYTRLKDVTLNYTVPQKFIDNFKVQSLSIYVSGRNLYTFTNWIGLDPEEREAVRGATYSDINYPAVRTIVAGINISL